MLGFAKSFLALIRRKTLIFSVYDETSGVSDRCMDERADQFFPKEHRPFWSLYLERGKKEQKKNRTQYLACSYYTYTLKHTQTNAHAHARANAQTRTHARTHRPMNTLTHAQTHTYART